MALSRGATMGELRLAIWRMTGVPWTANSSIGQPQVLILRGKAMPTDDEVIVTASGLTDGDVVQLGEDKSVLKGGWTHLHSAARDGVKEVVRQLA